MALLHDTRSRPGPGLDAGLDAGPDIGLDAGLDAGNHRGDEARRYRRMMTALLAAGIATFAELYAVQGVLPEISATLGVTAPQAALSVSAATTGLALGVLPWAWGADRIGRLPAMKLSVAGAVVLGTLACLAPTLELLLTLRFLAGAALGGVPVLAVSYVHEQLSGPRAAAAAAAYISGTTIGGAAGRLVAGPLAPLVGWRGALLAVGALSLAAAVTFVLLAPPPQHPARSRLPQLPRLRAALRNRVLVGFYLAAPLVTGSFVAVYNFLGFRLAAAPFGLPTALISLIFLTYAAGTFSSRWAGAWLPRIGHTRVVLAGLAAMAIGLAATLPDSLVPLIAGLIVFTAGFFVVHAAFVSTTGAVAAPDHRGQASALYTIGFYVGSGVLGWALGLLFERGTWALMAAAITALLAVVAVLVSATAARARSAARG